VWISIYDLDRGHYVYKKPIRLDPAFHLPLSLNPGRYRMVFKNQDGVTKTLDTPVEIVQNKIVFHILTKHEVSENPTNYVNVNGKVVPYTVTNKIFVYTLLHSNNITVPEF
jgi:hypothetical protein